MIKLLVAYSCQLIVHDLDGPLQRTLQLIDTPEVGRVHDHRHHESLRAFDAALRQHAHHRSHGLQVCRASLRFNRGALDDHADGDRAGLSHELMDHGLIGELLTRVRVAKARAVYKIAAFFKLYISRYGRHTLRSVADLEPLFLRLVNVFFFIVSNVHTFEMSESKRVC